jgi:hypothetical protein
MENRKKSNRKTLQAPLLASETCKEEALQQLRQGLCAMATLAASKTCAGVKAHNTRLRTATIIHLDGAHLKDVVKVVAKVAEAPTEVEGEDADGSE